MCVCVLIKITNISFQIGQSERILQTENQENRNTFTFYAAPVAD